MKLTYNGDGRWINGIPARDLDQSDLDRLIAGGLFNSIDDAVAQLTRDGLYQEVKTTRRKKKDDKPDEIEDNDDGR